MIVEYKITIYRYQNIYNLVIYSLKKSSVDIKTHPNEAKVTKTNKKLYKTYKGSYCVRGAAAQIHQMNNSRDKKMLEDDEHK